MTTTTKKPELPVEAVNPVSPEKVEPATARTNNGGGNGAATSADLPPDNAGPEEDDPYASAWIRGIRAGRERSSSSIPGVFFTQAFGINNAGQIVGTYSDSTGNHGFLDNDAGQIVGSYQFADLRIHGFLATPKFAGTPGKPNCIGKSVSALVQQYGGLNAAAKALDFPSVEALRKAILKSCEA